MNAMKNVFQSSNLTKRRSPSLTRRRPHRRSSSKDSVRPVEHATRRRHSSDSIEEQHPISIHPAAPPPLRNESLLKVGEQIDRAISSLQRERDQMHETGLLSMLYIIIIRLGVVDIFKL